AKLPPDRQAVPPWLDTAATSVGDRIPDGLTEDEVEVGEVVHPAYDPRITGDGSALDDEEGTSRTSKGTGRAIRGDGRPDRRKVVRGPEEWLDLLRAVGVQRDPKELLWRYYRELAMPHIIPFPTQRIERAGDPLPEGLEPWEPGSPLERIAWFETLV